VKEKKNTGMVERLDEDELISERERSRIWGEAMEEWLEDRRVNHRKGALDKRVQSKLPKQARRTWIRLLEERGQCPWELRREDIEVHVRWMWEKGYANSTTANAIGYMQSFYRWCGERGLDPECGKEFNPAAGVRRPKVRRYAGVSVLSRGEVERLLRLMRRDESPLGKRDYAFVLLRLRSGAPLKNLKELKWALKNTSSVNSDLQSMKLPGEVWEAMERWLRAKSWNYPQDKLVLGWMKEGMYVFTPLRYPGRAGTGREAEDWIEDKPLSSDRLLANLKLYGRRAGIAEEKLTLMALRRTAVRMRMEEVDRVDRVDKVNRIDRVDREKRGDWGRGGKREKEGGVLDEMKEFLESREEERYTKYRMKFLPQMPEEEGGEESEVEAELPVREARPFKPGEGITHEMYAHSPPPEEVRAVMEEQIEGIEEDSKGCRGWEEGCSNTWRWLGTRRKRQGWRRLTR
jgi:hypothetical protein